MYLDIFLHKIKKFIPKKIFNKLQPAYHFFMSWLAAVVYKFPSEKLIVIGVTGTTGKTTSVYLIANMLNAAGYKTGFTSTAIFNDGEKEWLNDKKMTMIGRFFMQKMLAKMAANKCQYAIVETTSEGIVQFRHRFINYDLLIFTGLYEEHIESHGSFNNYRDAKGRLFSHLKTCKIKYVDTGNWVKKSDEGLKKIELKRVEKTIIVNGDDEYANFFLDFWADKKMAYAKNESIKINSNAEIISYKNISADKNGISFTVNEVDIYLKLLGEFNAANAMTAVCIGLSQKIDINLIKSGLESVTGIPGRLEIIDEGQDFIVIIDYAFEPNALSKLYDTICLIPHNKIIHVLGSCGGGRDIARRPKLGKLAGKLADFVIVTNEDPYDDDPEKIIMQVALGAESEGKKINYDLFRVADRRDAIKKAFNLATNGDIVLITGKGSEQAICVANGDKIPWDDRSIARGLLSEMS